MKCPYCNEELEICSQYTDGTSKLLCDKCNLFGDNRLFETITKTKQALDIAVKALESTTEYLGNQEPLVDVMAMNLHADLSNTLDQIKQITETKE